MYRLPSRPSVAAAALVFVCISGTTAAQNFGATPAHGSAALRPGQPFADDIEISVPAVGDTPQTNEAGCSGQYTLDRPEINLTVEGSSRPLRIYARSSHDTVLMVRTPAGEWLCNDDTDGTNPAVSLEPARPGVYHVWVGPYYSAGDTFPVTLYADAAESATLDLVALADGTTTLSAPLSPDPRERRIEVGADVTHEQCPGFYSQQPTLNLNYDGTGPLYVYARADAEDDLTLAVNAPDGTWSCNDDADGLNPGLVFDNAIAGLYSVWVGSFRSRARTERAASATLYLSNTDGPDPEDMMMEDVHFDEMEFPEGYSGGEDFDRDGVPTAGTLSFDGGAPTSVVVSAGGPAPNSVVGLGCAGFLDPARPTAVVDFTSEGGVLSVWAVSEADATLVVGLPGGEWLCNDDYDGLMPAVVVDRALPGRYPVWVGTFMDEPASATLYVSGGEPFE